MHSIPSSDSSFPPDTADHVPRDEDVRGTPDALQQVLREARRLHRAAQSPQLHIALPVLRRLIASGALTRQSLPELARERATLQRKHVLQAIALEAGYPSWESWRPALEGAMGCEWLEQQDLLRHTGQLNLWFPDEAQARAHAAVHGGRVLRVGRQGVVVPPGEEPWA